MNTLTVAPQLPASQTLKTVDARAVIKAMADLLNGNTDETTTTLDVKNELRKTGYYAVQTDVSKLMHEMADGGFLSTIDTGNYCLFSVVTIVSTPIQIN